MAVPSQKKPKSAKQHQNREILAPNVQRLSTDNLETDEGEALRLTALDSTTDYTSDETGRRSVSPLLVISLSLLAIASFCAYAFLFLRGFRGYWFNPRVTTDDAMQQSYMFHQIKYPDRFKGDLITDAMESYLAPLHYWLTYGLTWLTESPIMAGHWVMAIQVGVSLTCIFFATLQVLRRLGIGLGLASIVPACFTAIWFLHSRHILQRMTGGLPRGWAGPILTATLCFALYGNHYAVLGVLLIGCLTNPPSTIIAALFYGMVLCWRSFVPTAETVRGSQTDEFGSKSLTSGKSPNLTDTPSAARVKSMRKYRRQLVQYILLSPIYAGIAYTVSSPPEFLGVMASYEDALENPAFSRAGGRFAFVPLAPASVEIMLEGFFAFISEYERIPASRLALVPKIAIGLCLVLLGAAVITRRRVLPAEVMLFFLAIAMVYFASRPLAFHLYVPDRHLRLPLGFFYMVALPSALWAFALGAKQNTFRLWLGVGLLVGLGGLIYSGSGLGLRGHANFNTTADRKGPLFDWLRENTPESALIAGHPSHIDDTMLFAIRKAFITAETAHPFFDLYYQEVERRLRIVWKAYYATELEEFYAALRAEGIDYFIFRRNDFARHTLAKATYFQPFTAWVAELASREPREYAFYKFPLGEPHGPNPVLPFRDRHSIVVDLKELGRHLGHEE